MALDSGKKGRAHTEIWESIYKSISFFLSIYLSICLTIYVSLKEGRAHTEIWASEICPLSMPRGSPSRASPPLPASARIFKNY